jgi:hypothetical protein
LDAGWRLTPAGRNPSVQEDPELRGPLRQGERRRSAIFLNLTEKRCFQCGGVKPLEEFTHDKRKVSGAGTYCRECDRKRSKAYYRANRERILAQAAAKRGPRPVRHCSECGLELEGRRRVTCGSAKCREGRFKRLQPESYARREAAKVDRRRERRRSATKA